MKTQVAMSQGIDDFALRDRLGSVIAFAAMRTLDLGLESTSTAEGRLELRCCFDLRCRFEIHQPQPSIRAEIALVEWP